MTDPHDTESLFAEWLMRWEVGERESMDDFAARYPTHAKDLLAFHGSWGGAMAFTPKQIVIRRDLSPGNVMGGRHG